MSAADLIEQMRPMTAEEKRAFVERVWEEYGEELGWVDPDLTPEQAAELDRRLAEFETNPHAGIPMEQVQREMRQRFGYGRDSGLFSGRMRRLSSSKPWRGTKTNVPDAERNSSGKWLKHCR